MKTRTRAHKTRAKRRANSPREAKNRLHRRSGLPADATWYAGESRPGRVHSSLNAFQSGSMNPTDTTNPDYFHRVVDCQWACPAHTDVPQYIRLIAQGRFTDAYLLNPEFHVFPAILRPV